MPTLSEVVADYMFTDEIASLAKSTKTRVRIVLNDLSKVAGPTLIVSRLNRTHVDRTVAGWRAKGLAESSINQYKTSLRKFGAYLHDSRLVRDNPSRHLKLLRTVVDHNKRVPLTEEQVRKVVLAASWFHERDRVCVLIALYTGLRASELVALRWSDVDFDAGLITAYRPKVVDSHVVPMSDALHGILTAWRVTCELRCGPIQDDWYICPALQNDPPRGGVRRASWDLKLAPLTKQTNFHVRLKGYLAAAGVKDLRGKSTHVLRRTSGSFLLDSGASIRDVQYLLGHKSEAQTQIYLNRDTARDHLAEKVRDWKI